MKIVTAVILGIVSMTGYGQDHPKATTAAAPAQAPASVAQGSKSIDPADLKELQQGWGMYQVDQLSVQSERNKVVASDPVAKRAMEILNQAIDSSPDVKKAQERVADDRRKLQSKIDAMKKQQGLGADYDWDFNQSHFVQVPQVQQTQTEKPSK